MVSRQQLGRVLFLCSVSGLFLCGVRLATGQAAGSEFACCLTSPDVGTTFQCHPLTNPTECLGLGGSPADSETCASHCASPTNRPPDCTTAHAFPPRLDPSQYPPNHQFVPIDIEGVTDPDGDSVLMTVGDIFQDEKLVNDGSGQSCPDGDVLDALVRAERQGKGNGRVYHIDFTADDGNGGTCQGTTHVCVPHDSASACVDDGPLYDSTDPVGCEPPRFGYHSVACGDFPFVFTNVTDANLTIKATLTDHCPFLASFITCHDATGAVIEGAIAATGDKAHVTVSPPLICTLPPGGKVGVDCQGQTTSSVLNGCGVVISRVTN